MTIEFTKPEVPEFCEQCEDAAHILRMTEGEFAVIQDVLRFAKEMNQEGLAKMSATELTDLNALCLQADV